MEYKYLVMVTSDNHNKYYEMIPQGSGFIVNYGRVGASPQVRSYSEYEFDKKYNEKLRKGYIDQTDLRKDLINVSKNEGKSKYLPIQDKEIAELINYLQKVARQKIADNYTISTEKVTNAMVEEAQNKLNKLSDLYNSKFKDKKDKFNDILLELFNILPRKMGCVVDYLAKDGKSETLSAIYIREQDLLNVMKGQVIQKTKEEVTDTDVANPTETILQANGLTIEPINEQDKEIILKELGEIKDKFYKAWRVTNKATRERFDNEIAQATNKTTKLLWHGSKNENWFSIMSNGLLLNPNATITGKMFGFGLYMGLQARKSFNYTSYEGSYWAHGNSDRAFMGLYDIHYGNPYIVNDFNSRYYKYNYEKLRENGDYNSLHADSSKGMLRNDEIIVYQESQADIRYLVELR